MEILRGTVSTAKFYLPTEATSNISASYSFNGAESVSLGSVTPTDGVAVATLPYLDTEGKLKVTWSFTINATTYTREDTYEVVTPILEKHEIAQILDDETDEEISEIEKGVRHIISAHTGQTFGKFLGTFTIYGSGNQLIRLPRRLISLQTINGSTETSWFTLSENGWYAKNYPRGVPSVRADYYGLHQHAGGVIHNPNNVRIGDFQVDFIYEIKGLWGYEEVPAPVREAAKLLINDYSCADSLYRDRFLTSMTAADWRIQFHDGAFTDTGNVRANQLLAQYVRNRDWEVV